MFTAYLAPQFHTKFNFYVFSKKLIFRWKPEHKEKLIFDHPNWQQKIIFLDFFKKSVAIENPNVGKN